MNRRKMSHTKVLRHRKRREKKSRATGGQALGRGPHFLIDVSNVFRNRQNTNQVSKERGGPWRKSRVRECAMRGGLVSAQLPLLEAIPALTQDDL